jgi:hypothetical protein
MTASAEGLEGSITTGSSILIPMAAAARAQGHYAPALAEHNPYRLSQLIAGDVIEFQLSAGRAMEFTPPNVPPSDSYRIARAQNQYRDVRSGVIRGIVTANNRVTKTLSLCVSNPEGRRNLRDVCLTLEILYGDLMNASLITSSDRRNECFTYRNLGIG